MAHRCFDLDVTDGVAHLVLSRPDELNTMVPEFWRELPEIVRGLSASGEVRALVISSTGRHFTAGMDLAVFQGESSILGTAAEGTEHGRRNVQTRQAALLLQESFTVLERGFTDVGTGVAHDAAGRTCVCVVLAAWPRVLARTATPR